MSKPDKRRDVIAVAIGTFIVCGSMVWAYGSGPRWSETVRGFTAGICVALLLANIAAWQRARRAAAREAHLDAETQRVAKQFADAVQRELAKRGIAGEVEHGVGLPPGWTPPGSVH